MKDSESDDTQPGTGTARGACWACCRRGTTAQVGVSGAVRDGEQTEEGVPQQEQALQEDEGPHHERQGGARIAEHNLRSGTMQMLRIMLRNVESMAPTRRWKRAT